MFVDLILILWYRITSSVMEMWFGSQLYHTKDFEMVSVAPLLGSQHQKGSSGPLPPPSCLGPCWLMNSFRNEGVGYE